MFCFENNLKLSLLQDGQPRLEGISLSFRAQNGKSEILVPHTVSASRVDFSGNWGTASLTISQNDTCMALRVEATLVRDRSKGFYFDKADTNLHSHGGVELHIASLSGMEVFNANTLGTFWTASEVIDSDLSKMRPNTQAVLYRAGATYGLLLAVCDAKYKSMFSGCADGGLSVWLQSYKRGMTAAQSVALLLGYDSTPYGLSQRLEEYGLQLMQKPAAPATEKRYPEILEYLGWCSWDAFPCCVSHDGLLEKAAEFKEKGIPVRWAIIDDMWEQLDGPDNPAVMHDRKLTNFEADPTRFPKGLRGAVQALKSEYGMQVGIWHPLVGYWNGIAEDSPLAQRLAAHLTHTEDGRLVVSPALTDVFAYHNAFYAYLKACGVDFVKVDCQSALDWFYKNLGTVGEMATSIHTAIEAAAGAYFDTTMINCMGCASENIWNRPNSLVNRCSNDFLPENKGWFTQHILQCSNNCYYYSGLYKGDWDMFWTDDAQAQKNCILRAISGGPIYVSDKVGRSVKEKLLPCVLSDGRILRCTSSAVPTVDCLLEDPKTSGKAYTLWNTTENGFVMAAFNLDGEEREVSGTISPFDLPDADADCYLAYAYFTGTAQLLHRGESISLSLQDADAYVLYHFVPVKDGLAPIGLLDKYNPTASFSHIVAQDYKAFNGGTFGFYAEYPPETVWVDGKETACQTKNGYTVVELGDVPSAHILKLK